MFKFLDPSGCTYYQGKPFVYNLPQRGEKWAITEHPEPAKPDGKACGPGRLHLMKKLDASYAPTHWWPWWAVPAGETITVASYDDEGNIIGTKEQPNLIGEDNEKTSYQAVKLRRINCTVFWRTLCPPFNWGSGADLRRAILRGAILRRADLSGADLYESDLRGADLSKADLSRAYLYESDLRGADLSRADLRGADLRGADLSWANLSGADLSEADLRRTDLSEADLSGAILRGAIVSKEQLESAIGGKRAPPQPATSG